MMPRKLRESIGGGLKERDHSIPHRSEVAHEVPHIRLLPKEPNKRDMPQNIYICSVYMYCICIYILEVT